MKILRTLFFIILIIIAYYLLKLYGTVKFVKFGTLILIALFIYFLYLFFINNPLDKLTEVWKKEAPKLILQLFILGIIGGLIMWTVLESLKPQTDMDVECKIAESVNKGGFYDIGVTLKNRADFAGKNFHIYVNDVITNSWGSDWKVDEQCERVEKYEVDWTKRFNFYCDFIPPKTNFEFTIYRINLTENAINTNQIEFEWWGETTPHETKSITCKRRLPSNVIAN